MRFLRPTASRGTVAVAVIICLCLPAIARAQTDLSWYTIDGGGITFATDGGSVEVGGTVGQPDVGEMTDGTISISGGFWFAVAAPMLTVPADIAIDCGDSTDPSNTGQATATDDCDGNPVVTYSDSSSGSHPTIITRTWRADDDCGNSSTGVQTITVNDIDPPTDVLASPASICGGASSTLTATVPAGQTVDWFNDGCGGTLEDSGASIQVSPSVTTTYYAQARDTVSGCVSFTCTPVTVTVAGCDDGDACTDDSCDTQTGQCVHTSHNCDDSNPCTDDSCVDGTCVHANNSSACNDGDPCTDNDTCAAGACHGTPHDCDDSNPCTDDSCVDGACVHTSNSVPCNDNNACTDNDTCGGGVCSGTPHNCDDGNACTDDSCNPQTGCVHTAHNCDDSDACTDDGCNPQTGCTHTAHNCNDGDPCTVDSCDPQTGCVHTPLPNFVSFSVQFGGGVMAPGPVQRCIRFELWNCSTNPTAPVYATSQALTFTNGLASGSFSIPCGYYECITARDRLHTLRRTVIPTSITGGYSASFTGLSALIGGNLNDDKFIDIIDFGIYTTQDLTPAPGPGGKNTDCTQLPPFRHADINGDGIINSLDYSFIADNFLRARDANCCGAAAIVSGGPTSGRPGLEGEEAAEPVWEIAVSELNRRGMGDLAAADLNHDGVLNQADVQLYLRTHPATERPAEATPNAP